MVLANKYRPKQWADVQQEFVSTIIKKQIESNSDGSCYLFTGKPGTGKTSIARIMASEWLGETSELVFSGKHPDLYEINCADNTGVDFAREFIIEKAKFLPTKAKRKVFILDEVHSFSAQAQNSLLKLLEEPPEHCKFILCTTELQKVLPAIQSRSQVFILRNISCSKIVSVLEKICISEEISYDKESLELIAEVAEGSLRNAITTLQQVQTLGLNINTITNYLNLSNVKDASQILELLANKDRKGLFSFIYTLNKNGYNLMDLIHSVNKLILDIISLKLTGSCHYDISKDLSNKLNGDQLMKISTATKSCIMENKNYISPELTIQTSLLKIIEKI